MATTPAPEELLLLLTSVRVALRSDGNNTSSADYTARERVHALAHAIARISEFLDFVRPELWTLPRAYKHGLLTHFPCLALRTQRAVDRHVWKLQCSRTLVLTVTHNDVATIEWLHAHCPPIAPFAALVEAAATGNLRFLKRLTELYERAPGIPQIMDAAAANGHLDVVQWLDNHPKNVGCTSNAMVLASHNGHAETLKWLYAHYCDVIARSPTAPFTAAIRSDGAAEAAGNGDLPTLMWLLAKPEWEIGQHNTFDYAAASGHVQILEWLHVSFPRTRTRNALALAALHGHLDVVRWLCMHRRDAPCEQRLIELAASGGHLNVVQWLCAHCPALSRRGALDAAAANGHLAVVQCLHTHYAADCTTDAMDDAASHGHLDVVQWLHLHRKEGCTDRAMDLAAHHGHLHVVQWLDANRTEGCTTNALGLAAAHDHLDIVQWLHHHHQEGATVRAVNFAAKNGHVPVVVWLLTHRTEGFTLDSVRRAALHSHLEVLQLLYTHISNGSMADDAAIVRGVQVSSAQCIEHPETVQWLAATFSDAFDISDTRALEAYMPAVVDYVLTL